MKEPKIEESKHRVAYCFGLEIKSLIDIILKLQINWARQETVKELGGKKCSSEDCEGMILNSNKFWCSGAL
jgi:hypothetical protein